MNRDSLFAVRFLAVCGLILALLIGGVACAGNFTCDDQEILEAAEWHRAARAEYWTGSRLADWETPCPIVWAVRSGPGAGATSFDASWRPYMEIRGNKAEVLADVIPHEVDHAVRHTILPKKIVRLWDEGAACLAESQPTQARWASQAWPAYASKIDGGVIDDVEYPQSADKVGLLYGLGLSLSQYVVGKWGPERHLQLQASDKPSQDMQQILGVTPAELMTEWRAWYGPQYAANQAQPAQGEFVEFTVALGCIPCVRFKNDWEGGLLAPYRFRPAKCLEVLNPTFFYKGQKKTGYDGPDDLKAWLASVDAGTPQAESLPPGSYPADAIVQAPSEFTRTAGGPLEDLRKLKEFAAKAREDIKAFQDAGVLGKVASIGTLREDAAKAKELAESAKSEIASVRTDTREMTERGWPIWLAVPMAALGFLRRRYAA